MKELTETQRQVFDFVREKLLKGHSAPTRRELCAQFGWSSVRSAVCHLDAIIQKGWLVSEAGKARSLRLANSPKVARHNVVAVPLLGSIPAGFSSDREQAEGECVPVPVDGLGFKPTRNTFALRVKGDSMIGRHVCDGDIVLFEHGAEPRSGQMVAALIDRKSTLKTFVVEKNGRTFLKAENPQYPNLIPSEELVIQGVFKGLIRPAKE